MTDPRTQPAGTLAGLDLTIADATPIREASRERCVAGGVTPLTGPKRSGEGPRFPVIQDPAGAVLALMQRVPE